MRTRLSILAAIAITGFLPPAVLAQRGFDPREVRANGWLTDYRQAKDAAAKTGKPIFLVFRCVP